MKTFSKFAVAFTLLLLRNFPATADVKFAAPFGDHMVLQRDQPIAVWGKADNNASVDVSLNDQKLTASADATGQWHASFKPFAAGGPFVLSAKSGDSSTAINDVLIGDVWLCSGQSNMGVSLKECDDGPQMMKITGQHSQLRLAKAGLAWTDKPQTKMDLKWTAASSETAGNFTAVGYYFAHELLKDPAIKNVPVGMIQSCVGGTMCEAWIPQSALSDFDPKMLSNSMFGIKPTTLYNGMIAPLGAMSIKGVIWYQGEGNAGNPERYPKLLTTLISSWRKQFANEQLPFLVIQLPDYATDWGGVYWQWMRESQQKVASTVDHVSLVPTINTNDGYDLHPKKKHEIGRRGALMARQDVYGEQIVGHGPVFKSATVENATIRVKFEIDGDGLIACDAGPLRGFMLAGEDGVYHFADAVIDGDDVIVSSSSVPQPKTVRYAWAGVPDSSLVNHSNLPAMPFRTDDFPVANSEMFHQREGFVYKGDTYNVTVAGNGAITSLIAHGQQFISNEPNEHGGNATQLSLDTLQVGNEKLTGILQFSRDGMTITLTNHDKADVKFQIPLAMKVETDGTREVICKRRKSVLNITGADSVANSEDGKIIEVTIGPKATKVIKLSPEK